MSPGGKDWYTAAELAEIGLPGLPRTKRKVNERAAEDGWALRTGAAGQSLARPRRSRGGGLEYHRDVLPAAPRAALAAMGISAIADVSPQPETRVASLWRDFERATEKTRAEAKRRAGVIALVARYEDAGLTRSAAVATSAARSSIGASTIWSWIALVEGVAPADRLPYLAPRRTGGGAEAEIDPAAWQFLLSDYLRPEQPTFTSCYYRMREGYAAPRGLAVPHERTLRRKLEREVDGRLVIARREGAEALRRTLPPQQRTVLGLHAMEAVNADGHKFDVFVRWPDGRIGRPLMVAVQDLHSRKIVAHRIDETENALTTRLVFADLFRDWGVPRHFLLDNGRAFASKAITGGAKTRFRFKIKDEDPTGVLPGLGIQVHWATPYRGQSKPIERAFRDLCDTIAKHPAFAGAYTGNSPNAKPENYGNAAVPIADFIRIASAGIAGHNAKLGRRTEGANGRSFDQVFLESYTRSPIGRATPEQLRLALLTAEERPCDRQTGTITLDGNRYWTPELSAHCGTKLTIRFDPENLHSEIHAYDREGRFIATAPVIEATGFFDKASSGKRSRQEAELRRLVKEQARVAGLLDAAAIAAMLPDDSDAESAPEPIVIRPVRHRGTAAALKLAPIGAQDPLKTPVIDRVAAAAARARLRLVD